MPWYYMVKAPILLCIRYYSYFQQNFQYFLIDFCYWANFLLLVQIIAFPTNKRLFMVAYAVSHGPLIWAVGLFKNSLVFHSVDKTISAFIHVSPYMVLLKTKALTMLVFNLHYIMFYIMYKCYSIWCAGVLYYSVVSRCLPLASTLWSMPSWRQWLLFISLDSGCPIGLLYLLVSCLWCCYYLYLSHAWRKLSNFVSLPGKKVWSIWFLTNNAIWLVALRGGKCVHYICISMSSDFDVPVSIIRLSLWSLVCFDCRVEWCWVLYWSLFEEVWQHDWEGTGAVEVARAGWHGWRAGNVLCSRIGWRDRMSIAARYVTFVCLTNAFEWCDEMLYGSV